MRQRFWLTVIFSLIVIAFLAFFSLLQCSLITGSRELNASRNQIAIATVCFSVVFVIALALMIAFLTLTHRFYGRFSYLAKRMMWFGIVMVILSIIAVGLSGGGFNDRDYQAWASGLDLVLSAFYTYQVGRFIARLWFPA